MKILYSTSLLQYQRVSIKETSTQISETMVNDHKEYDTEMRRTERGRKRKEGKDTVPTVDGC